MDNEGKVVYWRLFKTRFTLYSLIQLGLAWKVSTGKMILSAVTPSEWINIGVDMLVIWGGTMLALFDQTISRVAKGQLPQNGGDTTPPFPMKSILLIAFLLLLLTGCVTTDVQPKAARLPPMPPMRFVKNDLPPMPGNVPPVALINTPHGCPPAPDGYPPYEMAPAYHYNAIPFGRAWRTNAFGERYLHIEYAIMPGKIYELQYTTALPSLNVIWAYRLTNFVNPSTNWIALSRLGPFTNAFTISCDMPIYTCESRFFRVTTD